MSNNNNKSFEEMKTRLLKKALEEKHIRSSRSIGGNAPRKALGGGASTSTADSPGSSKGKYAGGNTYCPRPTPEWQKGIGMFLSPGKKGKENAEPDTDDVEVVAADQNGSSGSSSSSQSSTTSSNSADEQTTSQDD